jgi:glutathione reductase (NADPH)
MERRFDIIVIGSGVAGSTIARACRAAGRHVAIIDERPFGGTCALHGCTPKKVLRAGVHPMAAIERYADDGLYPREPRLDWPALMAFKRRFTDPVPTKREQSYAQVGINAIQGRARFVHSDAVVVGDTVLAADHIVIATGARPATLPIDGAGHLATSDDFLAFDTVPERLVLVGGGYIAVEFAHIAARAGSKVTILERGPRLLEGFDPDMVDRLVERTHDLPVDVRPGTEVVRIERTDGGFRVHASLDGRAIRFDADKVVHAAGRVPDLTGLDLGVAVVAFDKAGVTVNEHLQSISNPRVYAAGDAVARGLPLTPAANLDAAVVADNLLRGNRRKVDYRGLPKVVFAIPPLASVGLREDEARAHGLRFRINAADTADWFTARHLGETCAGYKVLIEEGTGRILGAHLIGPGADETINLFALAIRHDIRAEALADSLFAFPTAGGDIKNML